MMLVGVLLWAMFLQSRADIKNNFRSFFELHILYYTAIVKAHAKEWIGRLVFIGARRR